MRKTKTYHVTLPDLTIKEVETLIKQDSIKFTNRSSVIALAVHEFFLANVKDSENKA